MPAACSACGHALHRRPDAAAGGGGLRGKLPGGLFREYVTLPECPGRGYHPECVACASCGKRISVNEKVSVDPQSVRHLGCPSARVPLDVPPPPPGAAAAACGGADKGKGKGKKSGGGGGGLGIVPKCCCCDERMFHNVRINPLRCPL